jgi:hypothetical protein
METPQLLSVFRVFSDAAFFEKCMGVWGKKIIWS